MWTLKPAFRRARSVCIGCVCLCVCLCKPIKKIRLSRSMRCFFSLVLLYFSKNVYLLTPVYYQIVCLWGETRFFSLLARWYASLFVRRASARATTEIAFDDEDDGEYSKMSKRTTGITFISRSHCNIPNGVLLFFYIFISFRFIFFFHTLAPFKISFFLLTFSWHMFETNWERERWGKGRTIVGLDHHRNHFGCNEKTTKQRIYFALYPSPLAQLNCYFSILQNGIRCWWAIGKMERLSFFCLDFARNASVSRSESKNFIKKESLSHSLFLFSLPSFPFSFSRAYESLSLALSSV